MSTPSASRQTSRTGRADRPRGTMRTLSPVASARVLPAVPRLQRAVGNLGMGRLIAGGLIQTRLAVNRPGDRFEQEADRVADVVMRMASPHIQRACPKCEEEHRDQSAAPTLQAKGTSDTPEVSPRIAARIDSLQGGGQPLPAPVRDFFEPRLGHDFSRVRVHTDVESTRSLHARAYTTGTNIVFGAGQYQPGAQAGRHLLAHELVHVIQQDGQAPVSVLSRQESDGDPDAGVPAEPTDAGADSQRDAQDACVQRLGGCPNTRPGGIPTAEEIRSYNETCRQETGYTGADVQPSCPVAPEPAPPPLCSTVMGGRLVDHWTGTILRQEHTYVNFEEGGNRWLIEAGPDPSDPHVSGAWVKQGQWESNGNRVWTSYNTAAECSRLRTTLFDTTTRYHASHLPYDAVSGPNSNSFAEQLTFKAGVPATFDSTWDHKCYYWQEHGRPF